MSLTKDKWVHMPHPGHFICASECKFVLNTYIGGYLVSTVGEYLPGESSREILAESRGIKLEGKGDAREYDYMRKIGFEKIGCDRLYETMVFKARKADKNLCCPYVVSDYDSLDFEGYNTPEDAFKGHNKLCAKWAKKGKAK